MVLLQEGGSKCLRQPCVDYCLKLLYFSVSSCLLVQFLLCFSLFFLLDGQNAFERSVLLALKVVDAMLTKQSAFLEQLRAHNSSILATPIEQLLLAINPRTGRPDHFVNIAR